MAALDFPASPSLNQQYSSNNAVWKWNGSAWIRLGDVGAQGAQGVQGAAGAQGAVGAQGAAGAAGAQGVQGAIGYASTNFIHAQTLAVVGISTLKNTVVGGGTTELIVHGDARVTGVLSVGQGSVSINERDIYAVGVATFANFKTGTTNVHNVGVEAAGINVLGADTPIGTGATVYNSGLIVGKKGAEFQGVVTASSFSGSGADLTGITAGYWGQDSVGLNTNTSVGVNTSTINDKDLQGIGNTFNGMYISNGMMIYDNALSGNHYIGTAFNGLMAGPVTIHGTLSVDGQYVVV